MCEPAPLCRSSKSQSSNGKHRVSAQHTLGEEGVRGGTPSEYPPGVPLRKGNDQVTLRSAAKLSHTLGDVPRSQEIWSSGVLCSPPPVQRIHLQSWTNLCHALGRASLERHWGMQGNHLPISKGKKDLRQLVPRTLPHRPRNLGRKGKADPQSNRQRLGAACSGVD